VSAQDGKAGYTPGPWKAERHDGGWAVSANHMCSFPGMLYHVVECVNGDKSKTPKKGTPEANARLIAAAPALVEFVCEWLASQGSDVNYMTEKARTALRAAGVEM
jgi:hypothetical protein